MQQFNLGPNGGLMYCMEYLEKNIDWLQNKLQDHQRISIFLFFYFLLIVSYFFPEDYILFDCPGQVELYTHHKSMRNILKILEKDGYRVCL